MYDRLESYNWRVRQNIFEKMNNIMFGRKKEIIKNKKRNKK
jgi:hypothetical protein